MTLRSFSCIISTITVQKWCFYADTAELIIELELASCLQIVEIVLMDCILQEFHYLKFGECICCNGLNKCIVF